MSFALATCHLAHPAKVHEQPDLSPPALLPDFSISNAFSKLVHLGSFPGMGCAGSLT
jgi:hypothetical protein